MAGHNVERVTSSDCAQMNAFVVRFKQAGQLRPYSRSPLLPGLLLIGAAFRRLRARVFCARYNTSSCRPTAMPMAIPPLRRRPSVASALRMSTHIASAVAKALADAAILNLLATCRIISKKHEMCRPSQSIKYSQLARDAHLAMTMKQNLYERHGMAAATVPS